MASYVNFAIDVPEELREIILNKLPQEQIIYLRCVCYQLMLAVDFSYKFEFNKSILLPHIEMRSFPHIKIRKYNINRLSALPLYSKKLTTLFAFPYQIRSLHIETIKIRITDYRSLLQECCESLMEFYLEISDNDNCYTALKPRITFKLLKTLQIRDERTTFQSDNVLSLTAENDVYLNVVENIDPTCPLKSLVVTFNRKCRLNAQSTVIPYMPALFALIGQHPNSLQEIQHKYSDLYLTYPEDWQSLNYGTDVWEIYELNLFDRRRFINVKNLTSIHLKFGPQDRTPDHWHNAWRFLLRRQKNLKFMSLECLNGVLADDLFGKMISQNSKTLEEVKLMLEGAFFGQGAYAHVDMKIFQNCQNLKTLTLLGQKNEPGRLQNFTLPDSVEVFKTSDFKIDRDELGEFFSVERKITFLVLAIDGMNYHDAVTGSVIYTILEQPHLLNFYLYSEFRVPINRLDSALEAIVETYYPTELNSTFLSLSLARDSPSDGFRTVEEIDD